jgi:hypothetical protein
VWWQAPARAGKSALMSWFALHPPPDVSVVSYFVTARLASQADSVALTGGPLDQPWRSPANSFPQVTSLGGRDRLRRRLLSAAVAKARRRLRPRRQRRTKLLERRNRRICDVGSGRHHHLMKR